MTIEVVTITNVVHVIAVPFGMRIDEAWLRIQAAWEEGVEPWPKGTLIKCYCQIITHPSGRLLAVQVA